MQVAGFAHRSAEMLETVDEIQDMYDNFDSEKRIIAQDGEISTDNVTAVAPDGTVLIRKLTFS